jgi:hypothetical protein
MLVHPHSVITYPGVLTYPATKVLVFPGMLAPAVAILQWVLVELFVGWYTRTKPIGTQVIFSVLAVGAAGATVFFVAFLVFRFGVRFP